MNPRDERLQGELDRLADAWRATSREPAGETPPPALDAAIRAAARREVAARPTAASRPLMRRWQVPLATAAVVVLSVTIGIVALEERPEFRPDTAPGDGSPAVLSGELHPAVPAPPAVATSPPAAASSPPAAADVPAPVQSTDGAPAGPAPAATAPAPVTRHSIIRQTTESGSSRSGKPAAERAKPAQTPPAAPATGVATPFPAEPAPVRPAVRPAPSSGAATGSEPQSSPRPDADVRTRSLAAPLPARKEAAPFAAGEAETRTLQKQQRAVESLRDASPAGDARLSAQPPAPGVAEARHLADRPPEEWLAAIRQLRATGQTQAADELLARFRERFPAYPLPAGF